MKARYLFLITLFLCCYSVLLTVLQFKHTYLRTRLDKVIKQNFFARDPLVEKYLYGKNGIEIGSYYRNDFHLYQHGAYLNVDFQLPNWLEGTEKSRSVVTAGEAVNIVASGDSLPFKDGTFDYVFNSHVMEHFFDPIKAIKEHLRVIKKGGYLFYIIPNVDVIYDKGRDVTNVNELVKRHNGLLSINDYYKVERKYFMNHKKKVWRNDNGACMYSVLKKKIDKTPGEFFVNNLGEKIKKSELKTFKKDYHHHWNVWRLKDFITLAKYLGLNIVEYSDKDGNIGNGFVVVIQK